MYSLEDYDFLLPEGLIAERPIEPRDASRLLVLNRATRSWEHRRFNDLLDYLNDQDVLVANSTRVIPARFRGYRILPREKQGGKVEVLLLKKQSENLWEAAFHASVRGLVGVRFKFSIPSGGELQGEITRGSVDSPHGTVWVQFDRDPLTSGAGSIPLPPYINRDPEQSDEKSYQTIYAKTPGSVAAPTAGLHFTPQILEKLKKQGVGWQEVLLNVGLGTFRPVKVSDIRGHEMHAEDFEVEDRAARAITEAKQAGKRIVAVGTTSVRVLETAWDSEAKRLRSGAGSTSIFLYPGGPKIRAVDRLITNFHLPKSTLLMLVSSLAGRDLTLAAYQDAVKMKYRFFSYGDAMLIL